MKVAEQTRSPESVLPSRFAVPLAAADLIYHAALLAGMGPQARTAADQVAAVFDASPEDRRTCIDAGNPLMFSLVAPNQCRSASRSLRVLVRSGLVEAGVLRWLRTYYLPEGETKCWNTLTYIGEPATAWEHARKAAERTSGLHVLRQMHAILGPRGHLCSVSWPVNEAAAQAWVSWQLDRTLPADKALEALGIGCAWAAAARVWEALLGQPARPRLGPWSISLRLGDGESRMRLGSTNWARCPENPDKRRRLAAVVECQGGDRRYAEALYKLIDSARHSHRPHTIGRAVELEFSGGQLQQAEFYLCVPRGEKGRT
jgi:hypothetical protein